MLCAYLFTEVERGDNAWLRDASGWTGAYVGLRAVNWCMTVEKACVTRLYVFASVSTQLRLRCMNEYTNISLPTIEVLSTLVLGNCKIYVIWINKPNKETNRKGAYYCSETLLILSNPLTCVLPATDTKKGRKLLESFEYFMEFLIRHEALHLSGKRFSSPFKTYMALPLEEKKIENN